MVSGYHVNDKLVRTASVFLDCDSCLKRLGPYHIDRGGGAPKVKFRGNLLSLEYREGKYVLSDRGQVGMLYH